MKEITTERMLRVRAVMCLCNVRTSETEIDCLPDGQKYRMNFFFNIQREMLSSIGLDLN